MVCHILCQQFRHKIRFYCQKLPYFVVMHDAFIKLKRFWNPCYDVSFFHVLKSNNTEVIIFYFSIAIFFLHERSNRC